jgi:hypothetical protein
MGLPGVALNWRTLAPLLLLLSVETVMVEGVLPALVIVVGERVGV